MNATKMNQLREKVGMPPIEPHIPYSERCANAAAALTREKRQEFIDNMVKGHMTLGQAHEAAGISFEAALGIMDKQIKSAHYLETEVSA